MAAPRDGGRASGPFTLPSIAAMTQGMAHHEKSPPGKHGSDMMRDSGMWSMQSPSKHSSTVSSATGYSTVSSNNGLQLQTILNSDDSPNRFSSASATSAGTPASARIPSSHGHALPALNRAYTNDNNPRASIDANNTFFIDSRRSSVDSRSGNVNLDNLALNSASPYDSRAPSHRASEASLASNYQQPPPTNQKPLPPVYPQQMQQHPRTASIPAPPPPRSGSFAAPPMRAPASSHGGQAPRRAPVIQPNPRSTGMPNPLSSTPTKGFAWAFPDSKDDDFDDLSPQSSRQGSMVASSLHTTDSNNFGMRREDSLSTSMQHKALSELQANDPLGAGNYSRTPELRVSHKLAERKRRSEMKDLFDNLNRILPNPPGNKSSKWEVLSKSCEYIHGLKDAYTASQRENDKLRAELEQARTTAEDNQSLNNEILVMFEQLCRLDPNGHKAFGPRTQQLVQQEQQRQHPQHPQQPQQPQRLGQPFAPMQGVEYSQYERR